MRKTISKNKKWEKIWTSKYSFFNCVIFGAHYIRPCEKLLGVSFSKIILIYKKGLATLYRLQLENERFGKLLAEKNEKRS